jgi:hypothetical protein
MATATSHPSHAFARRIPPPRRIIIAHGEKIRTFTVRPWLLGTVVVAAAVFSVLYLTATGYLVFRDDILAASFARQAEMKSTYEDRIAALRADIDRLTSRQLLNQQQVKAQMDRLLDRQAALDTRQDIIAGLSQAMRSAGLAPAAPAAAAANEPPSATATKASFKSGALSPGEQPGTGAAAPGPLAQLDAVSTSLNQLAQNQVAFVDSVATGINQRSNRIAAAL